MKIELKHNLGFKWFIKNDISFKGYFFIDNNFYKEENAVNFLSDVDDLLSTLNKINGVFTIIKKTTEQTLIISDISRSFPIFYSKVDGNWLISDDIQLIKNQFHKIEFNNLSCKEFLACNHVFGNKTLIKNIFQSLSSEVLTFDKSEVKQSFFFTYTTEKKQLHKNVAIVKKAKKIIDNCFLRNLKAIQNQQVVVPLSSGFDSRLIAVQLKKLNITNVICYTYGKKNSFEIETSKKVAEQLNFKWIFIEYHDDLIVNFLENQQFLNFVNYASKYTAMPNFQEYFAVKYLKDYKIINDDAIFISGYAGDILGGSEYKKYPQKVEKQSLANIIFDTKFLNTKFSKVDKKQVLENINLIIKNYNPTLSNQILETVLDDFNLKERIAKYIFNSANFYSFFGYQYIFPFWDKELVAFFKNVHPDLKKNKSFYDELLINEFFKEYSVNFTNDFIYQKQKTKFKFIKSIIKPFLPNFIKQNQLDQRDWNHYKLITKPMLKELEKNKIKVNRLYKDYNEIITQWFLYQIKSNNKC